MSAFHTVHIWARGVGSALTVIVGFALIPSGAVKAQGYQKDAMLHGAVETTGVSGVSGTRFTLRGPNDVHAVYGFFSVETGATTNRPCYIAVRTENINDQSDVDGALRSFCGGRAKSSTMGVAFEDRRDGARVFVRGLRVCMNRQNTRVKGFQIRGRIIDEKAHPIDLEEWRGHDGKTGFTGITAPLDKRANCNGNWRRWVECPYQGQIATALIAHFDSGDIPRSLTGLALECRYAGGVYVLPQDRS